ncbi:MAG TPA: (Fe-S)-binding protein [Pseudogracilibacillus sp.]|nr:(Fe-S)-binding protein [Pseudogracilibacillus sp.]
MKVSLFITCVCDMFSPEVGKDTVELLEKVGCEVDFPTGQTCCGQPAYNSGYLESSKKGMIQIMKAFKHAEYIVGPSGSCVGMIKAYPDIFKGDLKWEQLAIETANKAYEITQFLVEVIQVTDIKSNFTGRVTYHPSCHMTRILGVKDAPKILMNQIKGLELIELDNQEDCCGFGGTFAVKNNLISEEMVKEKSSHITATQADYLVGGDMGCLMNIGGRMSREGKAIQVVHITKILNA